MSNKLNNSIDIVVRQQLSEEGNHEFITPSRRGGGDAAPVVSRAPLFSSQVVTSTNSEKHTPKWV